VIFILTDDQGSADLGCYGADDLTTPHIDALAARGFKLMQFYSAAPVCSPSRAGVLTGSYPWTVGLPGNVPLGKAGLPSEQKTMAEYFREAGYATAHLGKWHLGHTKEMLPNGQGFDYSFGHHGGCIDNFSHYFYWNGPNKHDLFENGKEVFRPGEFFPRLMKEQALAFTAKTTKPFFIYYAVNLPHYPYQAPTKWIKHYDKLAMPRSLYAAAVSAVDESLGELFAGLKKQGKFENTIIVYMSDHGHSTESRAFGGGGSSGGLRGAKFSLFEGGIRVPAIISFPEKLPPGQIRAAMASACDWLPTLLDLCEIEYQADKFTGKSLKKVLLEGSASPHDVLKWSYGGQRAVRKGDWKLICDPKDTSNGATYKQKPIKGYFLYNLKKDRGEKHDVSTYYPELVEELKNLLPK
jgi:arylsulfatase A-like enzyme